MLDPRSRIESAHANSSAVSSPCSASHAATPANPASSTRARSAAAFNHADKLTPRRSAALAASAATDSSNATESFRTATNPR